MPDVTPEGLPYALGTDSRRGWPATSLALAQAVAQDVGELRGSLDAVLPGLGLDGKKVRFGSSVVTVSGSGGVTVAYGFTFSSRPVVVAVLGDESSTAGYLQISDGSVTVTSFAARVLNRDGAPITTGGVRINWIAVGSA